MEKREFFLVGLLVLICCSVSSANVTNVTYADDGDGAFVCTPWNWSGNASELTLPTIYGDQYAAPGHLIFNVLTDGEDPTLKISNSIENDSTFAWTQFTVNITMAVSFTLTNVAVTTPGSWSVVSGDNQVAAFTGSNYLATVVYDTGLPIPNDAVSTIDFGYWVKFTGSPNYTITQEMIPVPEPSTFALLVGGLLMGGFALVSRRRNITK